MDFVPSEPEITDVSLAYDMACAENEFRVLGKLACIARDYAPLVEVEYAESTRYHHSSTVSESRLVGYFDKRANYASGVVLAEYLGIDKPKFKGLGRYEIASSVHELELVDSRKKLSLIEKLLRIGNHEELTNMSSDDLENMKRKPQLVLEQENTRRRQMYRQREAAKNAKARVIRNNNLLKIMVGPFRETVDESLLQSIFEADDLEPVTVLESPIRKDDIAPVVYELVAKLSHNVLRNADVNNIIGTSGTAAPTRYWKKHEIKKVAESLVNKFNGTVTNLSVMKLPVTDDWLTENYTSDFKDEIYAETINRLRFIAELKSTGKPKIYSQIEYGVYVRRSNDTLGPSIVATTRKINRMSAEAVQESLTQESIAIAEVVSSNSGPAILAGLPTLGKR